VEEALAELIPRAVLETEHERGAAWANLPPVDLLQRGSGWGALERLRREASGGPPLHSPGLIFDAASLSAAQDPWLGLLRDGAMPALDPDAEPQSYMVQSEWHQLLESAVRAGRGAHWSAWYHLGVMRHYAGDSVGAWQAWETSLEHARTPWALRNLAVLARQEGRVDQAAELYVAASRLRPSLLPLAVECGRALIEAGRPQEWLDHVADLPASIRHIGRIRLLQAQAALAVGDFPTVERTFADRPVVADMREGEVSLSQLWFDYHERRLSLAENIPIDDALRARVRQEFPVPREFDFRMRVAEPSSTESNAGTRD
jgi:hypothetical protein